MTLLRKSILLITALAVVGVITGSLMGYSQNQYVGSKSCAICHPKEKEAYDGHSHSKMHGNIPNEVGIGCESCHGPGQAHVALGPQKLKELAENKGDFAHHQ